MTVYRFDATGMIRVTMNAKQTVSTLEFRETMETNKQLITLKSDDIKNFNQTKDTNSLYIVNITTVAGSLSFVGLSQNGAEWMIRTLTVIAKPRLLQDVKMFTK